MSEPDTAQTTLPRLSQRWGWFFMLLLVGIAIFFAASNYFVILPTNKNVAFEGGLTALLLVVALLVRRQPRWKAYAPAAYAFFVASFVFLITSLTVGARVDFLKSLNIVIKTNQGAAADKLLESLTVVISIILLIALSGQRLSSIYLKAGNLKWGLIIGVGMFLNFAASALLFFSTRFADGNHLLSAMLWGSIFAIANGYLEEFWFRGLFVRSLQPIVGVWGAILLAALWYSLLHAGGVYLTPIAIPFMLINTFTFGVLYGYVTHKTDSIIAAGLMHAGTDFFLFMGMLSS